MSWLEPFQKTSATAFGKSTVFWGGVFLLRISGLPSGKTPKESYRQGPALDDRNLSQLLTTPQRSDNRGSLLWLGRLAGQLRQKIAPEATKHEHRLLYGSRECSARWIFGRPNVLWSLRDVLRQTRIVWVSLNSFMIWQGFLDSRTRPSLSH